MKTQLLLPGLFVASLLAFSQSLPAQAPLPVYTDNLVNGWQDWSWIPNNLANTNPVYSGTHSISASASDNDYEALSFEEPIVNSYVGGFNTSPYQDFVLYANGGGSGGQLLQVYAQYGTNSASGPDYALSALPANSWQEYSIPLSSLLPAGVSNLSRINIQLRPNGSTNTFYVDNIYFSAQPAPAMTQLSVNASQTLRTADPRWFGVNTATWDGDLDTSYTSSALSQAGVLSLRFPGGSESDVYNWETGAITTWSNNQVIATNYDSTVFTNFMHVATNLGAQAFITVNYGTGTSNLAAAWVLDANVTNQCNFKYWEVGNEVYGTWEEDTNNAPNDPYSYAVRFAGYQALMKAADPAIKVGAVSAPGEDSFDTYANLSATNATTHQVHHGWTPVMLATMKSLGVTPDFLVYHFYPEDTAVENPAPASDCDALALQVSSQVAGDAANLRYMISNYLGAAGTNTELVCTENNADAGAEGRQSTSLVNALYLADTLGQLMKTEFNSYTFWDLRNGTGTSGSFDPTLYGWRTKGNEGLINNQNSYYPDYYAMSMMQHFVRPGDTVLTASSSYLLLSAYASLGTNGALKILVINKDTNATFNAQISITDFVPSSSATVYSYGIPQDQAVESNLSLSLQQIAVSNLTTASKQFTNSFAPLSLTVFNFSPLPGTTVILTSGANPSTYGNPVTFTATVETNGVAVGGISGETVTFYNGATQIGSGALNTSGQASYTTAAAQLAAGISSITAAYSGDGDYSASTNSPALLQTINQATPIITWSSPTPIVYGAALGSTQLDASASTPGSFAYNPFASAVLNAGTQTLSVTFTPSNTVDYASATDSLSLAVSPAALTVTASNASRAYGQASPSFTGSITGLQNGDNITANYSCSATSSSPVGTNAITPTLSDPNNRLTNYTLTIIDGTLTIAMATPLLSWPAPSAVTYGTALDTNQLNATANLPGNFAYNPSAGAVLNPGTNLLGVLFTPSDTLDYSNATDSVDLVVSLAPIALNIQLAGDNVVLSWNDPASIFALQAAPAVTNVFTNVPGAASPYTNAITGAQQFFQLFAPAN
ncbi:MAG: MBG domain-containing protein [Verrucomicrobiota bacterium]